MLFLLISTLFAAAPSPAPSAQLPTGNSYRDHMLEWNAPMPAPAAIATGRTVGLSHPVAVMQVSSRFGPRRAPMRGASTRHAGLDIPGREGSPIHASQDGIVRRSGRAGAYGNLIEIDHGGGLSTRYAHLSRLSVRSGARVRQGEVIGYMGSTGRSTGSHLHFEVRVAGLAEDPLAHLGRLRRLAAPAANAPMERFVSAFAATLLNSAADPRLPGGESVRRRLSVEP